MDDVAIRVDNVSKVFRLPLEKNSSIKSAVINFYRPHSRSYEQQQALKHISFEVKKGEFFGIVGRNGSGKSTMLKLLAGIYSPSEGQLQVNGTLTPFIELGVGFNAELTGRENVFLNGALLGFSRKQMQSMYKDIVEFAELERFMDQKLKNYSSGMQVRLAFSLAIRAESDILLVDEVLAVGDADFQRKCFDYFKTLKRNKRTVVFVSHDMGAISEFCDRGILINDGVLAFEGPASKVADEYSMLFMEKDETDSDHENKPRHLGSGAVRINEVNVSVSEKEIMVGAKARAKEDVDEMLYGFHVIAQDGVEVTSMNNRMINVADVKDIKKGDEIKFQWKMMNILSDGKYTINLTLADGSLKSLDFFPEAAAFRVKRKIRSNTAVLPPISVKHDIAQ